MNILENKRVALLTAVFALAFGGLVYYGCGRMSDGSAAKQQLDEINEKVRNFESDEFPPTDSTRKAVKNAAKKVADVCKELKADFETYENKCVGDGKLIEGVELQKKTRAAIGELENHAAQKGCTIEPDARELGMKWFRDNTDTPEEAPYHYFQLKAAQRVAQLVVDAGAPRISRIFCATALPEAKELKKKRQLPLAIEVAFDAKRSEVTTGAEAPVSVLPQVLNSLAADKDFFFQVTGVHVAPANAILPDKGNYQAPLSDPSQGADLNGDEQAAVSAGEIASQLTGKADELARVYITLQVIYFTPNASKK
ncbi:MAG: Amuc_1100 family pilus-like protein [Akkermansia sp.]|nr:Amuc_1100 family pilus-like protein [Akkermansia sp.]